MTTKRKTAGRKRGKKPATPDSGDNPKQVSGCTFAFSVAQLKYLIALREAADEGRPTSDRAIAEELKMSRTTIWEWKHDPAFLMWIREEMKTDTDTSFELAVARHMRLAIRGSVRSFEAVARVRAVGLKIAVEPGSAVGVETGEGLPYSVILLSPRPPAQSSEPKQVRP